MPDGNLNDADYAHGSEEVRRIFRDFLMGHLVDFHVSDKQVSMRVGKAEVVFNVTSEMIKQGDETRMITRVTDVNVDR